MDLRPLSYEEMCQMELLHHAGTSVGGSVGITNALTTNTNNANGAAAAAAGVGGTTATMLPIMVIPTSMMPPGTIFTATATTPGVGVDGGSFDIVGNGNCEHYYQLQPTHILTTTHATPVSSIAAAVGAAGATTTATQTASAINCTSIGGVGDGGGGGGVVGGVSLGTNSPTTFMQAQPILLPTELQQHPQHLQQQQIPQFSQAANSGAATVNILYTGTLTKPLQQQRRPSLTQATLTRHALETSTLPRGFQPSSFVAANAAAAAAAAAATDESDFEGSECGASVSTTTCIPHFRFGGCGMILQPTSVNASNHHHHHHHHQQHEPQVIGCGSLSHMMGSFASAAGGAAMHSSGRLVGTLAGVSAGLSGTLGRNRRSNSCIGGGAAAGNDGAATAVVGAAVPTHPHHKRVSFKGDNLPPEEMQMDENALNADVFNNCSYMHFDNIMDYQTTGFGGLPDVTEHSNIRRTTLSRQNSISNSDSGGEIASIQKSKVNFGDITKSSPTIATSAGGVANSKRKSKAAQQHDDIIGGASAATHHYKATRRGSCVFILTLLAAICLLAIAATLAYQHFFMSASRNSHAQRLRIVRRILREVPLVDGHNNFAWNVRKYAHSSLELVHLSHDLEHNKAMWTRPAWAQTDMERLKQGLVGVQVWSAYVPCEAQGLDAVQLALEQIDIIRRLADMYAQETVLVTSSKDIAAARRRGQMASLIGIEGGHAIGSSLGVLRSFYSLGARYLSLTHKCDVSWAGSSASPLENGLTQFGKAIIREMNRLGMMIDLSYSSDVTARDVLQVTRAPVIFSHSAARQLCNSTRNIPDDILRLVAENGGLIMISFDSEDVACGRHARLSDVVEHIKYVRSISGIQHIGLGAGYDGIELPPVGLEDVSKYPDLLATLLEDPNWSEDDIAMLAGKNFLRIMETVENVRDYWKRAAIQPIEQTEPQPKSQCTYMSS